MKLSEVADIIPQLSYHGWWKVFCQEFGNHFIKSVDRIIWKTIEPGSRVISERIGEEIQTKAVFGDAILFHALGDS